MSPARKGKRSRKVAGRWQDRTNTDNGKRKEKRSTVRCRGRDNCCLSSIKKNSKRENLGKILRNGIRENVSYLLKRDTRSNNIKHKTRWHLASAAAKRRNRALPFYGFFFPQWGLQVKEEKYAHGHTSFFWWSNTASRPSEAEESSNLIQNTAVMN